ncbi:hypothetical protein B6U81_03905 [Thermoplasmatales archaeon ex4484_30]|nr:MAG: hypothetical protein B6U81_03905 [Thermoplasmatales archaeon ex4484_30]RLC54822.1 MAG: hypothetical protein DRI80_18715 [Chloroflexota bacterium]
MSDVVIGLGNPLLGDDGVGIEVASIIEKEMPHINVKKACVGGMTLAEMVAGYKRAIIIDGIEGEGEGEVVEIDIKNLKARSMVGHDVDFATAVKILSRITKMPDIKILGIKIGKSCWKEGLSPKIKATIPKVVEKVKEILEDGHGFTG